jgi:hypothetical protein
MAIQKARTRKYNPSQTMPPFEFQIPKHHLRVTVKITQNGGSIDKEEAMRILRTRPYVANVIDTMKYRGATSLYHVFSYPDPAKI